MKHNIHKEAAIDSTSPILSNMAVFSSKEFCLLFDVEAVMNSLGSSTLSKAKVAFAISKYIYGYIAINNTPESCGKDVSSIEVAAARKGFGPFMYDTTLSLVYPKYLMPDRGSVSEQASNVWKYYLINRPDVSKVLISGIIDGSCDLPESEYEFKEIAELYQIKDSIEEVEYELAQLPKKSNSYTRKFNEAQQRLEELNKRKQKLLEVIKTYIKKVPLAYKYKIKSPISLSKQKSNFKNFSKIIEEDGVYLSSKDYKYLGEEFFGYMYD